MWNSPVVSIDLSIFILNFKVVNLIDARNHPCSDGESGNV